MTRVIVLRDETFITCYLLAGNIFLLKLDLRSGYWQVEVAEEDLSSRGLSASMNQVECILVFLYICDLSETNKTVYGRSEP